MANGIYICKKADFDVKDGDSCKILTENELLECLDKSREHAMKGIVRDADVIVHEIRSKYRLQNYSLNRCKGGFETADRL